MGPFLVPSPRWRAPLRRPWDACSCRRGAAKSFGHVEALRGVDLDLYEGEILALVGDNGAGKSTLIKILPGALVPDEGQIWIDGALADVRTPADARLYGIETVYQDLAVVPTWTSPRTCSSAASRRRYSRLPFIDKRSDAPKGRRQPALAQRRHQLRAPAHRHPLRRAAPGGRGRPGAGLRPAGRDPGRAHRGARRARDDRGRGRDPADQRRGHHRRPDQPQPPPGARALGPGDGAPGGHPVASVPTAETDVEEVVRFITGAGAIRA